MIFEIIAASAAPVIPNRGIKIILVLTNSAMSMNISHV